MTNTLGQLIRNNASAALLHNPFVPGSAQAQVFDETLVNVTETGSESAADYWPELTTVEAAIAYGRTEAGA